MLAVSLVWVCVSLLFVKTDGNHRTIEKERYAERERERERERVVTILLTFLA